MDPTLTALIGTALGVTIAAWIVRGDRRDLAADNLRLRVENRQLRAMVADRDWRIATVVLPLSDVMVDQAVERCVEEIHTWADEQGGRS